MWRTGIFWSHLMQLRHLLPRAIQHFAHNFRLSNDQGRVDFACGQKTRQQQASLAYHHPTAKQTTATLQVLFQIQILAPTNSSCCSYNSNSDWNPPRAGCLQNMLHATWASKNMNNKNGDNKMELQKLQQLDGTGKKHWQ